MLTNILYIILGILIITTLYVIVRTVLFQRSHGSVEKIEGIPADEQQVAEHLAASVRCQTVPVDETGTPNPEAFQLLHQMLQETYPLVHQKLRREVVNDYSLLYIWQGTRSDLEPVMFMAHQDVDSKVTLAVRPWLRNPGYPQVRSEVLELIKARFDEAGIRVPYPKSELQIHQVAE